jgi:pimeloyl-ACP methyl ester carboxylesterase
VRVPVKGIWSDRDAFAGETRADRMAVVQAVHPEADIRLLEGAGHWMQYEAPARFNALLAEMLGLHGLADQVRE